MQVEAQLGASRERASELAWQLAEAEERERVQVRSSVQNQTFDTLGIFSNTRLEWPSP